MMFHNKVFTLSASVLISLLIHACQAEVIQDSRSSSATGTSQPVRKDDDATKPDDETAEKPSGSTTPPATTPAPTPAGARFTMSWDVSADAAIASYKVFIVPPDRNPRFPGKTDIPIQIKAYPLAALQKNGTKYSVTVTGDEIKTALGAGAAVPTAPCFTVVAVNAVGNSAHSPVICP